MPGCAPASTLEQVQARRLRRIVRRRRQHHGLGHAELHLAWRQVGDHDRQPPDQLRRVAGRLDPREDVAGTPVADVEREPQQLVRPRDRLGGDDARDAQVDAREVVDRDGGRARRWLVGGRSVRFSVDSGAAGCSTDGNSNSASNIFGSTRVIRCS